MTFGEFWFRARRREASNCGGQTDYPYDCNMSRDADGAGRARLPFYALQNQADERRNAPNCPGARAQKES